MLVSSLFFYFFPVINIAFVMRGEKIIGVRDVTSVGTSGSAIKLCFYFTKMLNCVRVMQRTVELLKMFYSHLGDHEKLCYEMTFELGIEDSWVSRGGHGS